MNCHSKCRSNHSRCGLLLGHGYEASMAVSRVSHPSIGHCAKRLRIRTQDHMVQLNWLAINSHRWKGENEGKSRRGQLPIPQVVGNVVFMDPKPIHAVGAIAPAEDGSICAASDALVAWVPHSSMPGELQILLRSFQDDSSAVLIHTVTSVLPKRAHPLIVFFTATCFRLSFFQESFQSQVSFQKVIKGL